MHWQGFLYFQFNVERDVGDMGLEDYSKYRNIASLGYLDQFVSRRKKTDCVKRLIAKHRYVSSFL